MLRTPLATAQRGLTQALGALGKLIRMPSKSKSAKFNTKVRESRAGGKVFKFALVPPKLSKLYLRRGRITAQVTLGTRTFDALMEPDGELGHWFKIPPSVIKAESVQVGEEVECELTSLLQQPDPKVPTSFQTLLGKNSSALETWDKTTALAKIDWIHWIESAKQTKTRNKRQADAIDMLQQGKRRVCCFDPSGFYSKALSAPEEP